MSDKTLEELTDFCMDISGGNPGALSVIAPLIRKGLIPVLVKLRKIGIKGSKYWAIHKDINGQDMEKTEKLLLQLLSVEDPYAVEQYCGREGKKVFVMEYLGLKKDDLSL